MTNNGGNQQTIKIRREVQLSENQAKCDTPIGDNAKNKATFPAQCFKDWQDVRIELPTGMFIKFLVNTLRELVKPIFVVFFNKRTQKIHIVTSPKLRDNLLTAPGIAIEARLAIEIVLGLDHALFYRVDVNV